MKKIKVYLLAIAYNDHVSSSKISELITQDMKLGISVDKSRIPLMNMNVNAV